MNALPWLLLVLVLAGMAVHFYKQYNYTLNSIATATAREIVVPSNTVANTATVTTAVTNKEVSSTESVGAQSKRAYEEALLDFQINAVSNNRAEWVVNVRGERSFRWKDAVITNVEPTEKTIHGIPLPPAREYPFTVANWELSQEINLNIEEEITKIVISTVQAHFIAKRTADDQAFKKDLQIDLSKQIRKFFDGFETLNKENIRR